MGGRSNAKMFAVAGWDSFIQRHCILYMNT